MCSPDKQPAVPSFRQRQAMWAEVFFPRIEESFPLVEHYMDALRPLYTNGRVVHGAFSMPAHPIFEWYTSRNRYYEMGFFEQFWKKPEVKAVFPQALHDLNFFDWKLFSHSSPFVLGGGLAWMLSGGGAYHQFKRGGTEAKRLGEEAALEMLRGSYDDAMVFECGVAWSDFFFDVAWDHTSVVIDPKRGVIHAMLATDTD